MRTVAYFIFIVLAVTYATEGIPHIIDGKDASVGTPLPYIADGKDAPIEKYPHQVSLRLSGEHRCGGSILDKFNVLTAAQCVGLTDLKNLKVHVGTNSLEEEGKSYVIESVRIHEYYDSYLIRNDIAIVHLENPIADSPQAQAIKLATNDDILDGNGISCTLIGWGSKVADGDISKILQETDVLIYPHEKCKKDQWRVTDLSQICTYSEYAGVCRGDTGGPLVCDINDERVQVGIVSFTSSCKLGLPNVHTRVTSFLPWIKANKKK